MTGADLGDGDAEVQPHALAAQHLGGVVVRAVGERAEQRVAEVDQMDLRRGDGKIVVLDGHRLGDEVGERAGELDAGRSAADDDERQRALVDAARIAVGRLEHLEDARAQPRRVVERVQREARAPPRRGCGRSSAASPRPGRARRP